jgi:hypothetical protein
MSDHKMATSHHHRKHHHLNPEHIPILVLFYLWEKGDRTKYKWSSSGIVGVASFDLEDDEYGALHIVQWTLPTIPEPTVKQLEGHNWADVQKWYRRHYELPTLINTAQPIFPRISAEDMALLKSHGEDIVDGAIVFNTTNFRLFVWLKAAGVWHGI